MNGLDLYNFVYDTFVRPKHPFASRDVRTTSSARGPQAALLSDAPPPVAPVSAALLGDDTSPRAVIVLADRRRDKT